VIRAVVFDFGNVLCFPPSDVKVEAAADFCGQGVFEFLEAFWKQRLDYDAGLMEPDAYWATVTGSEFAGKNLDQLVQREIEFWNDFDIRMFEWIATLRRKGIRVGMLSNLPRVLGEALREQKYLDRPFLDHFDHVTMSWDLKVVKPQPAIYHHAFEGLGVAASEALFIDDKLPNVGGALETGMRAELYTTWEDFIARRIPSLYGLPDA
jgi:putative hydrolase of the HAD superfamily